MNQVLEATDARRHRACQVGVGEVKVGESGEPLEPGGWELGHVEVVAGEVEVGERGQAEQSWVKAAASLQLPAAQVEAGYTSICVATADAFPAAAVRAGDP